MSRFWRVSGSALALVWLLVFVGIPFVAVLVGALASGWCPFWQSITSQEARFALRLTGEITLVTLFINLGLGVPVSFWIAKRSIPGWRVVCWIVELPLSVSPVVAGLALIIVYGPNALLGELLADVHVKVAFAFPGMVLATVFVTFPFIVHEAVTAIRAIGDTQEQAAHVLGASPWRTLWRIWLPQLKWSLLYGLALTIARSFGEFGAVLVVSGSIVMVTETATLFVYQASVNNEMQAAYAASAVLAIVSFVLILVLQLLKRLGRMDLLGH
ncbi:sulfate transport system permease protein [Alicyclobacillus sacchari]|uniref:Sulfate transport system permease protein n=1 Tax=Alicyclobacillus sacchari TaxID=392010 RepID=A0A4R8LNU9_9BACL|nr:ABC transporter permease subunit [Alicyclobacillus sacchari]TDY47906.1 sulfate transport system permease protein [Alicyclobacillus sacchari]GMA56009.1 sulfate ABC transporter permease subunit CysW [Alicyclobacillus sacchari]